MVCYYNIMPDMQTTAILLMGVAGAGKTTVGRALAEALGWAFVDADDWHPAKNVAKMARGEPLTDADREPWLDRLHALLLDHAARQAPVVLACSALKAAYRARLRDGLPGLCVVYLRASRELIRVRLLARPGHFMRADMLESQFTTLEEPDDALVMDAGLPVEALVVAVRVELHIR